MAERAAHLVDRVLPPVPLRQWVLTVPHRLRYLMAWDHRLCRAVLAVYVRVLCGWYRRRGRRRGWADPRTGTVTAIQRFGGGLNLHVHYHTLVLDGVFGRDEAGDVVFHPLPPPTDADVVRILGPSPGESRGCPRAAACCRPEPTRVSGTPLSAEIRTAAARRLG